MKIFRRNWTQDGQAPAEKLFENVGKDLGKVFSRTGSGRGVQQFPEIHISRGGKGYLWYMDDLEEPVIRNVILHFV